MDLACRSAQTVFRWLTMQHVACPMPPSFEVPRAAKKPSVFGQSDLPTCLSLRNACATCNCSAGENGHHPDYNSAWLELELGVIAYNHLSSIHRTGSLYLLESFKCGLFALYVGAGAVWTLPFSHSSLPTNSSAKTHNIIKLSFLLPPQQSGWTEKGLPAPPENSRSNNSVDSVTVGDFWSTFGRLRLGLFCSSFLAQRPNAAKSEPKATWELTDRNSESIRINQKRSQGTLQMARWRKALRNILGRTCQQLNGWNSKPTRPTWLAYRCVQTMVSLHAVHTAPVPQSSMNSTSSKHWARSDLKNFEQLLHTCSPSKQSLSPHECLTGITRHPNGFPSPSWPHCNCHSGNSTKKAATTRRINAECQAAKSST